MSKPIEPVPFERVFLVGYRCCGKSTVSEMVAAQLGWRCLDSDAVVEKRLGISIAEVFAKHGEEFFREAESEVLRDLASQSNLVVATGGGIVLRPENRALLRESGFVVWLQAAANTIWERMRHDESRGKVRPNLAMGGLPEIEELLARRHALYEATAHATVSTDAVGPNQVCERVLATLPRLRSQNRSPASAENPGMAAPNP